MNQMLDKSQPMIIKHKSSIHGKPTPYHGPQDVDSCIRDMEIKFPLLKEKEQKDANELLG
jgi:hypothetical protein